METARQRAALVENQLSDILTERHQVEQHFEDIEKSVNSAYFQITELNGVLASMHQRSAGFKHRADELRDQMKQLDREDPSYRHIRRTRAKVLTGLEDLEKEIEVIKAQLDEKRELSKSLEAKLEQEREGLESLVKGVDGLQESLPGPQLYVDLFEFGVGKAHCELYLDRKFSDWLIQIEEYIGVIRELHQDLRAGKYRIDTNSEFLGGRCSATADAIFAAVAIGKIEDGKAIFELACDPELYFHHIFEVYRCWCLGLYVQGRFEELKKLLAEHQYSEGLREAYTRAFFALLERDEAQMAISLRDIVRHEWELWHRAGEKRARGVVNFGAAALSVLALKQGMTVMLPADTIPELILT